MKIKQILALAIVGILAWFGTSQFNNAQARYEQDVDDYRHTESGDALPLQARVEKAAKELQPISLETPTERTEATASSEASKRIFNADFAENLLAEAFQHIGTPYRRGQSSPAGFDCSGFTSYVFKQMNIQLTRTSRSQFTEGEPVACVTDLRKGDLVFFGGSRGAHSVGHVGIVTEVHPNTRSFKFIHASTSAGIKVDDSKEAYFSRRYVGARRIIN